MKNLLKNNIIKLITTNFVQGIEYDKRQLKEFDRMTISQLFFVRKELLKIGHKVEVCDLPHGGGQVIEHKGPTLIGGSDPRKDGCAIGL